jgi:hypothetical protein
MQTKKWNNLPGVSVEAVGGKTSPPGTSKMVLKNYFKVLGWTKCCDFKQNEIQKRQLGNKKFCRNNLPGVFIGALVGKPSSAGTPKNDFKRIS